jgi:hypothetical protein
VNEIENGFGDISAKAEAEAEADGDMNGLHQE